MEAVSASTASKIARRIIPYTILLYFVAYLDRVNLGFAALQMNGELHFTPQVYGTGASVFFVGYLIAQIPANFVAGFMHLQPHALFQVAEADREDVKISFTCA